MKYRFPSRRKNTRKNDAQPLKDALQDMFKSMRMENRYKFALVVELWGKVMGQSVSSRTNRIFVKNNKLFVELSSAPLKNDLILSQSIILKRINEHLGENFLKEIVFL